VTRHAYTHQLEQPCLQAVGMSVVPEGLNDSSQAIYCLECEREETRPVGNGVRGNSALRRRSGEMISTNMPRSRFFNDL